MIVKWMVKKQNILIACIFSVIIGHGEVRNSLPHLLQRMYEGSEPEDRAAGMHMP